MFRLKTITLAVIFLIFLIITSIIKNQTRITETNEPIENDSEQLFDQDINEEEDFEIPAFLRKQKF